MDTPETPTKPAFNKRQILQNFKLFVGANSCRNRRILIFN